ncbi:MAG: ABC transporter ATP-binding protein [Desulfatirhabdiaceae bacterium]
MILELKGVTKKFGKILVINNFSFDVSKGQVKSVIGPNGAGKTTLFNIISGAYSPDSGKIIFNGKVINGLLPNKLCRLGLSRSFQITNIFQKMTVFENIRIALQGCLRTRNVFKWDQKTRLLEDKAQDMLELIGIWDKQEEFAGNLSHGDQRHLEIGIALASNPSLLLLDEPTAGMNIRESLETIKLINKFREKVTMLIIEHDMKLVLEVSDEIAVLQNGELLCEGPPETIRKDKRVQDAYLGEEL